MNNIQKHEYCLEYKFVGHGPMPSSISSLGCVQMMSEGHWKQWASSRYSHRIAEGFINYLSGTWQTGRLERGYREVKEVRSSGGTLSHHWDTTGTVDGGVMAGICLDSSILSSLLGLG